MHSFLIKNFQYFSSIDAYTVNSKCLGTAICVRNFVNWFNGMLDLKGYPNKNLVQYFNILALWISNLVWVPFRCSYNFVAQKYGVTRKFPLVFFWFVNNIKIFLFCNKREINNYFYYFYILLLKIHEIIY